MKTLKLLTVLMFISLLTIGQVSASGYSHNMFVAQKMLKAKKETLKVTPKKQAAPVVPSRATSLKPASAGTSVPREAPTVKPEASAVAFTQHLARWMVSLVCEDTRSEENAADDSDGDDSLNGRLVGLVQYLVSGFTQPVRALLS
jgi:hypothetical protein